MKYIEFTAAFGDENKKVIVSQPEGTGSATWHINVGGYHQGVILELNGQYVYVNDKLDSDDIQAIVDRIIEHKGEPWQRTNILVDNYPKYVIKAKYI